eukprot:5545123-Karenia_brevis.AAC.1
MTMRPVATFGHLISSHCAARLSHELPIVTSEPDLISSCQSDDRLEVAQLLPIGESSLFEL